MGKRLHQVRLGAVDALTGLLSKLETEYADGADLCFSYRLLLGREPDEGALQAWAKRIEVGVSRNDIISGLMQSTEFSIKQEAARIARIDLDKFIIFVDPTDPYIGGSILKHKTYEPHVTTVLSKLLKKDHIFVDVGASIGWFTLLAASLLNRGKVIAIEPSHRNLQLLYRSIIANDFADVAILPYAATDTNTIVPLSTGISNNVVPTLDNIAAWQGEYVAGIRLDDFLCQYPKVDVIKMDIEGHELKALRGLHKTITTFRPVIVTEFNPVAINQFARLEPSDFLREFVELGYGLSVIQSDGSELEFARADDVFEHWKMLNRKLDPVETSYNLDLIARPT